jgi:hypothetical protein
MVKKSAEAALVQRSLRCSCSPSCAAVSDDWIGRADD